MDILIVGIGYVGLVSAACLAEKNHNVTCLDVNKKKIEMLKKEKIPIYEPGIEKLLFKNYKAGKLKYSNNYKEEYKKAKLIIITVGTPERKDGSANLDYIYDVAKQIAENITKDCIIVIKSTVPVGTNDKIEQYINENLRNKVHIEVVSNPEFLSQGRAIKDMLEAKRIVIGTKSEKVKDTMKELYKDFNTKILFMDRCSSEMVKYASNDFLALKISYINDIANLCEVVGANIENVIKGMSLDDRIGDKFLNPGCGYGGSCFPKDTKALHYLSTQGGYSLKSIEATIAINKKQKIILIEKARHRFKTFKNKNISVLGLSFKPNTDDIREAPSIDNIEILLDEGANIKVYDPMAMNNFRNLYPTLNVEYSCSINQALKDTDICFIFTEWDEFKRIKPITYKSQMKTAIIYDGRNIYNVNEMKDNNIEYYSIGR